MDGTVKTFKRLVESEQDLDELGKIAVAKVIYINYKRSSKKYKKSMAGLMITLCLCQNE